jgi:Hemerythrin HHE cation binding domain
MADVFDVLAKDHEEVRRILAELQRGPTGQSGATGHQLQQRKQLTERLIIEESKHEAAEEMYFWPAVREHLANGDTLADEATGQEQEAKEVLARLDKLDADQPEFEKLLSTFATAAGEHIAFEELKVWPSLREMLTKTAAGELGTKVSAAKEKAPTRPHPHTPGTPGALKTAGAAAAVADKARDKMTNRGE